MMRQNIFRKIEESPETELEKILRTIMHKVETFGKLLRLDPKAKDFLKQVLRHAITLYFLLEESKGSLKEGENLENCIAILENIKSADVNKVQQSMYLARDIALEFSAKSGTKIE